MTDKGEPLGMKKGLTRYGDDEFALFLRKSLSKGQVTGMMRLTGWLSGLWIQAAISTPVMAILKT